MAKQHPQQEALYRPKTAFDLLRLPLVGHALRGRWGRLWLQVPFFAIAVLLLIDGFTGPQMASRNLATVAPWVHYRGFVIVALLLVGNLFCMGCPFMLPRTLAKRLAIRGRRFPRFLRNKWLAVAGLFAIFFAYEWLDLWASPALTAWVIVFYFVASFVLEAFFTESAFCKYVCPLGTFNFVYSTASPTQIAIRDQSVCATCVGKECINGSYAPEKPTTSPVIALDSIAVNTSSHSPKGTLGCGTELFAPQIKSNLDCTLCLDCVRACPHENVGLFVRTPGRELLKFGAWSKRWDISLLFVILAFMGLTNAFGMVPPVYDLQATMVEQWGIQSDFLVLFIIFFVGNIVLPIVVVLLAAWFVRMATRIGRYYKLREIVASFAPSFVPLGLGIWIAHYGFHFLIAPLSIIPVVQEFLGQTGDWATYATPVAGEWIGLIQVVALLGGFVWSMLVAQRVALRDFKREGMVALAPFALILLVMLLLAVQIFALPMEMRGTDFLFD
jgi:polyferredoxin